MACATPCRLSFSKCLEWWVTLIHGVEPQTCRISLKRALVLIDHEGIVAPANTPTEIIAKIEKAINSTLKDQEVMEAINSQGFDVAGTSAESFGQLMKADTAKWGQVIEKAGIKLNN